MNVEHAPIIVHPYAPHLSAGVICQRERSFCCCCRGRRPPPPQCSTTSRDRYRQKGGGKSAGLKKDLTKSYNLIMRSGSHYSSHQERGREEKADEEKTDKRNLKCFLYLLMLPRKSCLVVAIFFSFCVSCSWWRRRTASRCLSVCLSWPVAALSASRGEFNPCLVREGA